MASLALVLVFCVFVSLSDSACYRKKLTPGELECEDRVDKTLHPLGSTWTNSRCYGCACTTTEMECCDKMRKVVWVTKGCVVKHDYDGCTFDVVHPNDPSIQCLYGVVRK